MLPRKTGKPIAFKCTEELRQQTEAIADSLGESLSDYVRKAIEMRNTHYNRGGMMLDSTYKDTSKPEMPSDGIHYADTPTGKQKQPGPIKLNSPQEVKTFFKK